ncbi:hypothetical protein BJX64DRAFT_290564 [Aspergillus heterothallicus]
MTSKTYDDFALMGYAYAFEQAHSERRFTPPRAPELATDTIIPRSGKAWKVWKIQPPVLHVTGELPGLEELRIGGSAVIPGTCGQVEYDLEVYVDGLEVGPVTRNGNRWSVKAEIELPFQSVSPFGEINIPDTSLAKFVVAATTPNGRSDGELLFV